MAGRAGMLIREVGSNECLNCHKARKTGVVIIENTNRTDEEIDRTIAILL